MNGAYHFETERSVLHEQYEISDFPNVIMIEVVVAFNKNESFYLAVDYCD